MSELPSDGPPVAPPVLPYRPPASDQYDAARRGRRPRSFVEIFSGITALVVGLAFASGFGISLVKICEHPFRSWNWVLWIAAILSGLLMTGAAYRAWEFLFAPRWRGELPNLPSGPAVAVEARPPTAREPSTPRLMKANRPPSVTYAPPDAARQKLIDRAERRLVRRRVLQWTGALVTVLLVVVLRLMTNAQYRRLLMGWFGAR